MTQTVAPAASKASRMHFPIPRAPPVTTAILLEKSNISVPLCFKHFFWGGVQGLIPNSGVVLDPPIPPHSLDSLRLLTVTADNVKGLLSYIRGGGHQLHQTNGGTDTKLGMLMGQISGKPRDLLRVINADLGGGLAVGIHASIVAPYRCGGAVVHVHRFHHALDKVFFQRFVGEYPFGSSLFCRLLHANISSISAALVSGLTLGITFSIRPCSSMMNVVRTTPMQVLPHIFFSCHTAFHPSREPVCHIKQEFQSTLPRRERLFGIAIKRLQ